MNSAAIPESPAAAGRQVQLLQVRYYLASALTWFATALPMAVTVLYAQSRGFSLTDVGLYAGVFALCTVIFELPSGLLADAVGRKRVALLAEALASVALVVFFFADSLGTLLLYAVLLGASKACGSGALEAWFVDELLAIDAQIDLQPPLALANTVQLLALAGATLLGGLLPTFVHPLLPRGWELVSPLGLPLLSAALMHAVAFLAVLVLVREGSRVVSEGRPRPSKLLASALSLAVKDPVLLAMLLAASCSGVTLMAVETFWQPFFAARLGGGAEASWLFGAVLTGCFVAGTVGSLLAVPVARRMRSRHARVAATFHLLQFIALALLVLQESPAVAAALLWLTYLAMGGAASPARALFNMHVPSAFRSVMLSVLSLATMLGAFIGSFGLGWVADNSSVATAWAVAAVPLLFSCALLLRAGHSSTRGSLQAEGPLRGEVPDVARSEDADEHLDVRVQDVPEGAC